MNGDVDKAIDLARKNLRLRPDMAGVSLELAYLERARGNLSAAIVAAQKSVELRPLENEGLSLLAAYLTEAGRAKEAVALIEPHRRTRRADFDLLTALGLAHAALGQAEASREAFEEARRMEPQNPLGEVNLGTLSLMTGDRAGARRAMTQALAMDPGVAKAHNILGVMEAQEGRPEEAIAHWRLAAELNPQDYQTLFNLGKTLDKLGRSGEADVFYRQYLEAAPLALEVQDIERVKLRLKAGK
jgi:Flp pilus assembly protein TadD